jgi:fatty-acyl-CoA synthase
MYSLSELCLQAFLVAVVTIRNGMTEWNGCQPTRHETAGSTSAARSAPTWNERRSARMRVADYFDLGVALDPQRLWIKSTEGDVRFAEAQSMSTRIAAAMQARGLEVGDRAACWAPNHPLGLIAQLAIWRGGAAWTPMNSRNTVESNLAFMARVGVIWLFIHPEVATDLGTIRAAVPTLRHIVSIGGDVPGADASLTDLDRAGASETLRDWGDPRGGEHHTASINPTGGTTGAPKAVVCTHRMWAAKTEAAALYWPRAADPVNLMVAPFTHAAGTIAMHLATFGTTTVIHRGFDAAAVLETIERERVTHIFLPPTAFYGLLDHPDVRSCDLSSLRMMLIVAAPVAPEKLRRGVEIFGPCLCQCFGQAEAALILTWLDAETIAAAAAGHHPERLASCGRPTLTTQIQVMDDDGALLPVRETGELVVRGPLVMPGYFDDAEATAEVQQDGWHHTGDIGYRDNDGFIYIVDRKKDMIITGGFNVYSAEVESAVLAVPSIVEAAVIGVPDDKWGEAVTAVVARSPGSAIGADDVIRSCRQALGAIKAPKRVYFLPSLPKTPAGKVDKKAIRNQFWRDADRRVN